MINELNTLVQFLSAMYVTITIDNLMFKRFWTADLYELTSKMLDNFDFAISTPKRNSLLEVIKKVSMNNEEIARIRGGFFLMICISLLIFGCFEASLTETYRRVSYLAIIISIVVAVILYIVGTYRWTKWRCIYINFAIVASLFPLVVLCVPQFEGANIWLFNHACFLILLCKHLIILFLLIPIILRLILNWLYSVAYVKFIQNNLVDEYNAYVKTKEAIKNYDEKSCDPRYDEVYKTVFFSNQGKIDSVETSLVNKLVSRLEILFQPMSTLDLIKYRFSKEFDQTNEIVSNNSENSYVTLLEQKISPKPTVEESSNSQFGKDKVIAMTGKDKNIKNHFTNSNNNQNSRGNGSSRKGTKGH